MKPRALDLFCGAGGATMGLMRAGFHVTGVDINNQPRYVGDCFRIADALRYPLEGFDFIWASPVCKGLSQVTPKARRGKYPNQIPAVRERLTASGIPFTIENVPSARVHLRRPFLLCGSMFGLNLRRHRFFEVSGFEVGMRWPCYHRKNPVLITGTHRRTYEPRYEYTVQQCRDASGIDWMTRKEIDEAIPPAYSEFIGRQAIEYLRRAA